MRYCASEVSEKSDAPDLLASVVLKKLFCPISLGMSLILSCFIFYQILLFVFNFTTLRKNQIQALDRQFSIDKNSHILAFGWLFKGLVFQTSFSKIPGNIRSLLDSLAKLEKGRGCSYID